MLKEFTELLVQKQDLSYDQAHTALNAILDGRCSEVEIAALLTALAAKGESAAEVAGMARALRDHAVPVHPKAKNPIDIVGTGGDGQSTFNISTIAAFVIAGAGVPVAKHGNRAITSQCGSADLLDHLGVKIDAAPPVIEKCIEQANIGFMFAPAHHPAMKYVQPIRKQLGFRTIFNVLGPLANPAAVPLQIVGVAKPYLLDIMAEALMHLGVQRAMVVYGDGMDEFTICGPTDAVELRNRKLTRHTFDYSDYGIRRAEIKDLICHRPDDNLTITRDILDNKKTGPQRDIVLFNAAAALMLAQKAAGIAEGIALAEESIKSGYAKQSLEKLIEISNS